MPKEYKFKPNTPISEVFAAWRKNGTCAVGVERAIVFYAARGDKTAIDMAKKPMDIPTLCWDIINFGEETSPELRKVMLAAITDTMMAFHLYHSLPFLTDEEDKLLEEKFKGKLPTAENELATGVVKRAK